MHRYVSLALLALVALACATAPAGAKTKLVELRVEAAGQTLDKGTWYATSQRSVRVRKSSAGDACNRTAGTFGFAGATPMGVVGVAETANRRLRQVRVRNDEAGLFVCEIGSVLGRPFGDPDGFAGWSYYNNFVFGSAGADQLVLGDGDRLLWVYSDFGASTPANTGAALQIKRVPARSDGTFVARVAARSFDGTSSPAPGATIRGAESFEDLGGGRYRIEVGSGRSALSATRALDIPSNRLSTCFRANRNRCPSARGRRIVGSSGPDRIKLTRGPDRVNCGKGRDVVLRVRRDDRVKRSCEKVKKG